MSDEEHSMVYIHESGGKPELVELPQGAMVFPADVPKEANDKWRLNLEGKPVKVAFPNHITVSFEETLRTLIADEVRKALADFKAELEEDRRKREEAELQESRKMEPVIQRVRGGVRQ